MLAESTYPKTYIDSSRKKFNAQLAAYRKLAKAAAEADLKRFEPTFCAHQVLALDAYFANRLRGAEGKDGNPCNEVRVIANSWTSNDGVMLKDNQIKLDPASSISGLDVGDKITLDEKTVSKLASAYFDEIEKRFVK